MDSFLDNNLPQQKQHMKNVLSGKNNDDDNFICIHTHSYTEFTGEQCIDDGAADMFCKDI